MKHTYSTINIRNNWTRAEVAALYNTPLLELVYQAATVHRQYHDAQEVQVCKLLSIKTGGCPEDCAYCPQAARYHTGVKAQKLMAYSEVMHEALKAKGEGATAFVWAQPGAKFATMPISIGC